MKSRNERSIIDYVLISKRNRTDVTDVRIRRGAELYSDHYLLRAKIRMKNRGERKSIHIGEVKQKIKTSIKSHKLGEKEIAKKFQERTGEKIETWVNSNRCLNNKRRVVENIERYSVKYGKEAMWYKNRRWVQKRTSWWNVSIKEQVKIMKQTWKKYLKKEQKRVI